MTGPTGAGKSALAIALALRVGGEVIGADAFQIYAGLPILTAQATEDQRALVPHHLVGFLDLRQGFDAAMYAKEAWRCIRDIQSRGRVPILAGGTGLYLKALTHGLAEMPKADVDLRASITAMPLEDALAALSDKDPAAPAAIDIRNPVRVRRALEIVLLTGRPLAESRSAWSEDKGLFRGLVLTRDREDLRSRIAANVDAMFASGVVEEVKTATHTGDGAARAIGFREIQQLLQGEITESACKSAMVQATQRYAKRQLTWGRTQFTFRSLNLIGSTTPEAALSAALDILDSQTP
ncbi:MAG: tRNA (adenosine(37)-N6)-dimethylallyltransferase MiaA [Verrucomicrobia bacterium]|nr:tRNA (adenosine(37)-N6)-dimethylallyltransferase MiaA [Verrucomicrobiota bacterium]